MGRDFVELKSKEQIKLGDTLVVIGKSHSDSQVCKAEDIVCCGENEEIIICKERNRYFIVDMYLAGSSWAEDVFIVTTNQERV